MKNKKQKINKQLHLPVNGEASRSLLVSMITCGSLEMGTHTSVIIPWVCMHQTEVLIT